MNIEVTRNRVTAAEFVRRFGCWQEEAVLRPVYVTHHGRDRLVMLSVAAYQAMRARGAAGVPDTAAPLEPMLEQLEEGFFAIDRELRVREINPVAAGYLRLVRSAALGQPLGGLVPGIEETPLMGHLLRVGTSGEITSFVMRSPSYPGRFLQLRVFPYGEGAGCLVHDVTEEQEAGRRSDADAAAVAALMAHGRIGRARLTPRGTFGEVSEGLARLTGFSSETLLRTRLTDVLPLDRRVSAASALEAVLTLGEPRAFDTALLAHGGAEVPVRIALAPIASERGNDGATLLVTAA